MTHTLLIFIAAVFLLAGFVKGVIGLGLPTVSMGLLAVSMPPAHALAIVIVPGILTNIWQTFAGPYFLGIVKRLWPLLLGLAIGIRLDGDMMTGPYARYGTVLIGVLLVTYAIVSLRKFTVTVRPQDEKWVGGVIGLTTGVISGATGVQVVPSMPFMQALGMKKDELIQALGVFFTVATLVQAFNLSAAGLLNESTALPGVIALACSFTGMAIGQTVRTRLEPDTFRRWFLISMIVLGIYLAVVASYEILFRLSKSNSDAEIDKQRAEGTVDQDHRTAGVSHTAGRARGHDGDAEAPQRAVENEDQAEHQKRQRLVRRIGVDELRQKGEKEHRHFRIEHVGQRALPEHPRQRNLAALARRRLARFGRPREQHRQTDVTEIGRAQPFHGGECGCRCNQQRR